MWLVLRDYEDSYNKDNLIQEETSLVNKLVEKNQPAVSLHAATSAMLPIEKVRWMYMIQKSVTRLVVIPANVSPKVPTDAPKVVNPDISDLVTISRRSGVKLLFTSSAEWTRVTRLSQIFG